ELDAPNLARPGAHRAVVLRERLDEVAPNARVLAQVLQHVRQLIVNLGGNAVAHQRQRRHGGPLFERRVLGTALGSFAFVAAEELLGRRPDSLVIRRRRRRRWGALAPPASNQRAKKPFHLVRFYLIKMRMSAGDDPRRITRFATTGG